MDRNEDTKPVQEDFMAMYMIQFCIDTELEVTRTHADCGRKTVFTLPQISRELERRMVRNLAFALSRQIEALLTTLNRDCAPRQVKGDTVSMSIDDATFLHDLLSAYANNVRRGVNQLKRIVAPPRAFSSPIEV